MPERTTFFRQYTILRTGVRLLARCYLDRVEQPCRVEPFSSRVCKLGTNGCEERLHHA